jgi:hypothetical protein
MLTATRFANNEAMSSSPWVMLFRTQRFKSLLLCGALLWCANPGFGEVIDKILIVVNDRFIITLSDVQRERALQLALGTNLGNEDEVAAALVEKHLVEEQMAQYPSIEIPEERIQERMREIGDPRGFSPEQLRQAVLSKLQRSEFITQRFVPFIRVTDEEIQKYYNEVYVPEVRRQGSTVPSLEQAKETVQQNVAVSKISDDLDVWMEDLKRRAKVEKVSK